MPSDIKIQVRFNDLDAYGHVNNTNYLDFMEYARTQHSGVEVSNALKLGLFYVVVSIEISYKKPILFDDEVFVKVWISEARGAKFTVQYIIHDGQGKIYARAKSDHAVFNSKLGVPIRVPKTIIDRVENYEE